MKHTSVLEIPFQTMRRILLLMAISLPLISCSRKPDFDVVLRNGLICDGTGSPCTAGGVAISGDKIAQTGDVSADRGRIDIDVHGQIIAPGFINLMSGPVSYTHLDVYKRQPQVKNRVCPTLV